MNKMSNLLTHTSILGFNVLATVPETGQFNWAMLKQGDAEIQLQLRASLTEEIPIFKDKAIGGALTLYIGVEGIKELHDRLKDKVMIVQNMHTTQELKDQDPEAMYGKLCELQGIQVDRCMLYVFRCAVYYTSHEQHEPEKLKWWNWKDTQGVGTDLSRPLRDQTSTRTR